MKQPFWPTFSLYFHLIRKSANESGESVWVVALENYFGMNAVNPENN